MGAKKQDSLLKHLKNIVAFDEGVAKCPPEYGVQALHLIRPTYEFLSYEAVAGESCVIRGFDAELDCLIAVKIALPLFQGKGKKDTKIWDWKSWENIFDNDFKARFLRGSRIQYRLNLFLNKPFIVRHGVIPYILRLSETPLYVVMEFIDSETSLIWCKNKTFSEIILFFHQLLLFVFHNLHRFGIIHRDIKPGNVLVTHAKNIPIPVLVDFTTSKDLTKSDNITTPGQAIGTPLYMSPMQKYSANRTTYTDEVYNLGKTLYILLRRKEYTAHDEKADGKTRDMFDLNEIPEPLKPVIENAIELDTGKRYKTLRPFIEDLETAMAKMNIVLNRGSEEKEAGEGREKKRIILPSGEIDLSGVPNIVQLFARAVWAIEDLRKP